VGAFTALFAASIGLRQYDIKRVLAYSTISQLGYMFLGGGHRGLLCRGLPPGDPRLLQGAPVPRGRQRDSRHAPRLSRHPFHDDAQDMRNMGGLRRAMPWTFALMLIATLAIAGIPPLRRLLLQG
jgi:NADH-quinone oxidoreductase subunit L